MSEQIKLVAFAADGHPDEIQLLLALERELPAEDVARVEKHLGNCWSCRARFDEMQRGILAFVEYREKRYLPFLEAPPADFTGFHDRLRNSLDDIPPVAPPVRIWRKVAALLVMPRRMTWMSIAAAAMAAVIFWVQVVNPPIVSANELLVKAIAAQNPSIDVQTTKRRVARQRVQIRSGNRIVVRDYQWTLGESEGSREWGRQQDPTEWSAPITAQGFASWRDSLQDKKDEVTRAGQLLTLDTSTNNDRIKRAWIVVRAEDFHPVEQHLQFADDQRLDFTELAFQVTQAPIAAFEPQSPSSSSKAAPSPTNTIVAPEPADLNETEIQLRYALFMNQWDLGEDLLIERVSGQVILRGTVSSREREAAMRAALIGLPNVRLSLELPSGPNTVGGNPSNPVTASESAASSTPLLRETLEKVYASREERLAFVDGCLAASDAALSHAWAIKRLVERYSEADQQLLAPASNVKLREMLRVHLQKLSVANRELEALLKNVPTAKNAAQPIPSDWRDRARALFTVVQKQDQLVASLVVGTQTGGYDLITVSKAFRTGHEQIQALLNGLKLASSESTVR